MSPPLCVLLLLAAAAAVNAADSKAMPSPMFVDWLSQQSSTKVRSAGYEEVETESVCLQENKLRNCRCLNEIVVDEKTKCNREYSESTLSCCNSHGPGSFMQEKPLTSVCNWILDFFTTAVDYDGTATQKIGVFTATCEMREDSEKCGSPLCEGMSVIASGDILRYPYVAFLGSSEPEELPRSTDCKLPILAPEPLGRQYGAASRVAAKVQYSRNDDDAPEAHFWVGSGDIYSGTFRVTSRYHATKYKVGQFQMAYPTESGGHLDDHNTLPEKAYVAKANQINMEFLKTDAY